MKKIMKALLCAIMILGVVGCSSATLSKYKWGDILQEKLDEIGVDKIEKVTDESSEATKDMVANVLIKTDLTNLDALLSKNFDGTWDVLNIKDSKDKKIYYEKEHLQLNDDGTQKDDIYDYKTGKLVKEGQETKKEEVPKVETKKEETPKAPDPTLGQKNAQKSAKNYLNYSAFSYSGLVAQLEYEGFSNEEATYAADNCGADWNKQAAKKAQDYLDYSSFSRQGLLDQLLYEGYTQEQAEYGVTEVGY